MQINEEFNFSDKAKDSHTPKTIKNDRLDEDDDWVGLDYVQTHPEKAINFSEFSTWGEAQTEIPKIETRLFSPFEQLMKDRFPNVGTDENERRKIAEAATGMSEGDFIDVMTVTSKLRSPRYDWKKETWRDAPANSFDVEAATRLLKNPETKHSILKFVDQYAERFLSATLDLETRRERLNQALGLLNLPSKISTQYSPQRFSEFLVAGIVWQEQLNEQPPEVLASKSFTNFAPHLLETVWCIGDASLLQSVTELAAEAVSLTTEEELCKSMLDVIRMYTRNHPMTAEIIQGFREQLFPKMIARHPDVALLQEARNQWGMRRGDFGIGDFLVQTQVTKADPLHVNERMVIARTIPTLDKSRFEQNRLDALSIMPLFGILRDFIHDQRPYVHDMLAAMVYYYESGDSSKIEEIVPKTSYFSGNSSEYDNKKKDLLLDRASYDLLVDQDVHEWNSDDSASTTKIPAIDVLRRLVQNTEPTPYEPPVFGDKAFDRLISDAKTNNGALAHLIEDVNTKLTYANKSGTTGMSPTLVQLLCWLDHKGFKQLQNMSYERQANFPSDSLVQALIRFHELTAAPNHYDKNEVDSFLDQLANQDNRTAAQLLTQRITQQVVELTRHYRATTNLDPGILWSGNLTHELMALDQELHSAVTPIGDRYRRDVIRGRERYNDPTFHPGD